MSTPRLTEKDRQEIIRRYKAGESGREIGEAYGVHETYARVLARRQGEPPADRSKATKRWWAKRQRARADAMVRKYARP